MKPSITNPLFLSSLLIAAIIPAFATDLYWDADGATTAATGGAGTWQTASTWRSGSATGTLGNWIDNNTAVFGGTNGTGYTVALSGNVIADQIKIIVGDNAATAKGVTVGATTDTTNTISFGGSYNGTHAAIDTTSLAVAYGSTIAGKISGTISSGGLYIKGINVMNSTYDTGSVGRLFLSNAANDFVGDVTIEKASVHSLSYLGNAANKIILKNGGGLYGNSGSSVNYDLTRDIVVDATGGAVGSFASGSATVITKLASGKTISGSGNLTRYQPTNIIGTEEVWLLGGMSGYTGTFENVAGTTLIQTASTSAGAWKLTGGTVKLNTTNDTHIADGAGKSNLLMNGGALDMNGKNETINGLSGLTGTVQNQLAATTSTLTLGGGDATASFSGVLRNNTTSGGTLALIKTGSGTQTLKGANLFTGGTKIENGSILLGGGNDRLATTSSVVLGSAGASGKLVLGDGTARTQTLAGITTTGLGGSVVGGAATDSALTLNIASGTNTFAGTLGGAGTNENKLALTKTGAGTLELTGTNTYSGDTTVNGGTLILSSTSSTRFIPKADASSNKITGNGSAITLNGALDIDLSSAAAAPDTTAWLLVDVANLAETFGTNFTVTGFTEAPAGTWKKTVAQNTYTFTESDGKLVLSIVTNTFANWLSINAPATGFETDSDNDGIPNGVENVLGTSPNAYSTGLTAVSGTASSVTFQHTLNPTIASDVSYTYEWSTDLAEWKASGAANTGGVVATITPSAPVSGVVTVTTAITTGSSATLFTRIKANK